MVTYGQVKFSMGSSYQVCIVLRVHLGRSGLPPSTDFETMALSDAGVVYFTEYLSVLFQLTYLDELWRM